MQFPLGASVTVEELELDPHPLLARLREREPVSWIPALGGWLVTSYQAAIEVMRDAQRFTVADSRFSTARVLGVSMLSLDGDEHRRHREAFAQPLRPREVHAQFATMIEVEATRLLERLAPAGAAELRRGFAGPLAASVIARALGLDGDAGAQVLAGYDAIVAAVNEITTGTGTGGAGALAFEALRGRLEAAIGAKAGESLLSAAATSAGLTADELASNAGVLLFGGVETTEGMIANALLQLLERPDVLAAVRADDALVDAAIEESLRLEPAAAMVDRYATTDGILAGAAIQAGELVRVSLSAANRDPDVFERPERFDLRRRDRRSHLAFAHGPHVCLGVHLARLEARIAVRHVLACLPGLRLHPAAAAQVRGLVFRKPPSLNVLWEP